MTDASLPVLRLPVLVLNTKVYPESTGKSGLNLVHLCDEVAALERASIAVCPPQVDLGMAARNWGLPCFAQHVDAVEPGGRTGYVTLESIKAAGAWGTLVNHAEHQIKLSEIEFIVTRARQLGLLTIVCTNNLATSQAVAQLGPYAVAVEPPELIGTGRSVTLVEPSIVSNTVVAVKSINRDCVVLCGAGVTNGEDVRTALELGADGVLLASGVVKAADQQTALLDLVSGLRRSR